MKFSLILFLFVLVAQFTVAQKLEIKAVPNWVVEKNPTIKSEVSRYDVNSGVYTSLVDYQINLPEEADFSHFISHVVSNGGVSNASELYLSYDTAYQELQFHYLYIWRNGKKIDKTSELSFEILQNEQSLQSGIYTGLITAYDILEDVRKDDKIEYAYTLIGDNPIFDGHGFRFTPMEDTNPVDYFSLRIIYPKKQGYKYHCEGCDEMTIEKSTTGNNNVIELTRNNIPAGDFEETIPAWIIPYNYFIISSFKGWKEVNDWAYDIFQLEKDQDLDEVFEEIFTGDETTEEKINAIINYVQDDIRYMGIESGIGSIKPFPPEQVVKQRFGDCKDKSLLMISLFEKIGISTCYPALVNSSIQHGIDNLLPGGHLFDHCIVYFEYEGKGYWLDPTITQQGGDYKTTRISDYGKALVVKKGASELSVMSINDTYSRTEVNESFTFSSFNEPGTLKVESYMYGLNADYIRSLLDYYSLKEVSDELKGVYSTLFPSIIEAEKVKIKDDLEKNIIIITEEYLIPNAWSNEEGYIMDNTVFQYEPANLYAYISPTACETKKHPVQLSYPYIYKQTTVLNLPDVINIPNEIEEVDNSGFYFKKETELLDEKTIQLVYTYNTKTKEIAASKFATVCLDMNTAARDLPLKIFYPKKDSFKFNSPLLTPKK